MTRPKIGELLVAAGAITTVQLNDALQQQRSKRIKLGELLVHDGSQALGQAKGRLADKTGDEAPYFSMILVPGEGRRI